MESPLLRGEPRREPPGRREYRASSSEGNATPPRLALLEVGGVEVPWCARPAEGVPIVVLAGLGWRASGSLSSAYGRDLSLVALDYPRRWPRRPLDTVGGLAGLFGGVLDALGLERIRLLGVSLGGMVALRLALDRPALVESLALVSTAASARRISGWWRVPASRAIAALLPREAFYDTYRRWGPSLVGTGLVGAPRDAARFWSDPMSRRKMTDLLRAVAGFDETRRLGRVRCPTAVVHGRSDGIFRPAAAAELAEGIPGARLRLLDGADHFAFLTREAEVLKDLKLFWNSM